LPQNRPSLRIAARLGLARTGLAVCYNNRGEVERGRALAAEVLAAAEERGDREQALFGHTNIGVPEHYQGKFASSLAHCERASALYDPEQHHIVGAATKLDPCPVDEHPQRAPRGSAGSDSGHGS
jgi:predicted ATPase